MKKIILLSCLSFIPFSSQCNAMEAGSESDTGYVHRRDSFTENSNDGHVSKRDRFTTQSGEWNEKDSATTTELVDKSVTFNSHILTNKVSETFMSTSDGLDWDKYLARSSTPTLQNIPTKKCVNLKEITEFVRKTEGHLNSNLLLVQNNSEIKPEKIGLPNTTISSTLIIPDENSTVKSESTSEKSILDEYVIKPSKRSADTRPFTKKQFNLDNNAGSLSNNINTKKIMKKSNSLNTTQPGEKKEKK
ncbi:MAG: hypothetical protein H0X26_05355 [Alphaproteobacteria bacterium]|nr:hypothetical protein [Alphaproteobacteria bacterium]